MGHDTVPFPFFISFSFFSFRVARDIQTLAFSCLPEVGDHAVQVKIDSDEGGDG